MFRAEKTADVRSDHYIWLYGGDPVRCVSFNAADCFQRAGGTSFLDALFTSTSAVCVTGLIVHDTATYWTAFGQVVSHCPDSGRRNGGSDGGGGDSHGVRQEDWP